MRNTLARLNAWRGLSVAEAAILFVLVAALIVQHKRNGWPFSLHHGMGAAMPSMEMPASNTNAVAPVDPHAAHAVPDRAPVSIPDDRATFIGLSVVPATHGAVSEPFRAVATIAPDESRLAHVHTRVAGWVERLYVNTTGQRVRAGQALLSIFSQELLAAQTEYLAAQQASAHSTGALATTQATIVQAARRRLQVLRMSDGEIDTITRTGRPLHSISISAPRDGVVLHRGVTVGTAVDPSTELVVIADLSSVWTFIEIPETQIPSVREGTPVELTFPAAGVTALRATIDFLYPSLTEETRTLRARASIPNPTGSLRPGIYGEAQVLTVQREGLVVPRDAVVDTGNEQHVFVRDPDGRFVPRRVVTGAHFGDRVEVLEGLERGDQVVATGVFLLDSESRLRASAAATGGAHAGHAGHGH